MIYEWSKYKYLLSKVFQEVISTGMNMNYSDYIKAITQTEKCRQDLDKIFDNVDVLIAPCVDGEAPIGIEYAGNPRLPGLWTAVRLPSINLPTHIGPNGLPVSIQVIGRYRADDRLLSTSKWMLQKLGSPTLDLVS
jgi:Asp-tRNA(Asn)/Glu-tRNA(Gln) amidotransferase A subunit family amidase